MSIIAQAIQRNQRLHKGRVRRKMAVLKAAFAIEAATLKAGVLTSAADSRKYRHGMDRKVCPKIHAALSDLHTYAEDHHIQALVQKWVDERWGAGFTVSLSLCYGSLYCSWR